MTQANAIINTSNYRWFLENIVAASDPGCVDLFAMPVGEKPKLIRCDKTDEILLSHEAKGKVYDSWETVVANNAGKKIPLYYTPNTFYGNKRQIEHLCSLRACWVDFDCHGAYVSEDLAKDFYSFLVFRLQHDDFPTPTAVWSGRGIHLIWPIQSADKGSLGEWMCVQEALREYLEHIIEDIDVLNGWTADSKAQDAARILRMPGSYNTKGKSWAAVLAVSSVPRSPLGSLSELLDISPEKIRMHNRKLSDAYGCTERGSRPIQPVLGHARLEKMIAFAQNREWELDGVRNSFLTIAASFLAGIDPTTALSELQKLNQRLKSPLSSSEILATAKSCLKYRYVWSNARICKILGMTESEKKLFCSSLKGRAWLLAQKNKKDFRKPNRTRDALRAKRKAAKLDARKQFPILREKGYTAAQIAKQFGVSERTVKRYWNTVVVIGRVTGHIKKRGWKRRRRESHIRVHFHAVISFSHQSVFQQNAPPAPAPSTLKGKYGADYFFDTSVPKRFENKYS